MKFQDYKYERPDLEQVKVVYKNTLTAIKEAKDVAAFMQVFNEFNKFRNHINSMMALSTLRYTINTVDEFYSKENDYWDENSPFYMQLETEFYKAVLETPLRKELEAKIPMPFFKLLENQIRCFDESVLEDLQNENKVSSQYEKLIASADIEFDGEHFNLPGMSAKAQSKDRDYRKRASFAVMKFFEDNETEIDRIYDELVHIRDGIAKKLGFKNFTELGYVRMNRLDYNEEMVKQYRASVLQDVVPVASELVARQQKRLHLDEMHFYDLNLEFENGNPTPKGTPEELVLKAQKMYHELSRETGEFFDMMVEKELLDLVSKPNKAGGGYCTYIADYESPFIFSNFNGTSGDVDVLTHEAGHAFQVYSSKDIGIPELEFPTNESAEIHSMSMEFITWPWSKEFFQEDTQKYHFLHLASAATFIPYGICVDHFQHEVYNNPDLTPTQRKETWRKLEKQYMPYKQYDDCAFLDRGGYWFRQGHIFASPFYYIDYTLAQVCALQFWKKFNVDHDPNAWQDYYNLCKAGGTKSFLQLVSAANLVSPFKENSLHETMVSVKDYLDGVDDMKL